MTAILSACSTPPETPPVAARRPQELVTHGHRRVDDYHWMNDREDPEVIAYLEAENRYTAAVMEPLDGLRDRLRAEMKARIRPDHESVPYRHGDFLYYYRYEKGREYPIYCRRRASGDAVEQVLLDVNVGASGHSYYAVRGFTVSPDHSKAVYAVDTQGRRFFTLTFLDLGTGRPFGEAVPDVTSNVEWANDSRTLFYTKQDPDTLRWNRVYRHLPGSGRHELVYEETNDANDVSVAKSLSGRFIYLTSEETVSTEVRYLPADAPQEEPKLFLPRQGEHEYYVTDGGDRFFVLSNDGATNFMIFEVPLDDTSRERWNVLVDHREETLLEGLDVFRRHLVLSTVEDGLTRLEVIERATGGCYAVAFEEQVYSVYTDDNYQYDTTVLRYYYESMTTPESVYDFDLESRERVLVHEEPIPGGFDRHDYRAERLMVPARDGARIPVSLVYRKGFERHGRSPLLQYGYGSYGATVDPGFDSDLFSLLDRGFVFAIAHIRGSSLLGRDWYYDGRQLSKMNTFNDFIDVSRYLVAEKYTSPERLYAQGGSAGGLLVGAVINMAPELYRGVVAAVPFVDVVTTMLDPDIPLTTGEWDEWGNPADPETYHYMLSYSPYDNVRPQAYPHMLVTSGLHDSQVQYWEPTKWVAKLRANRTDDNLLLLMTDMEAGHGGKTGRYNRLEDTALEYAFFLGLEGLRD